MKFLLEDFDENMEPETSVPEIEEKIVSESSQSSVWSSEQKEETFIISKESVTELRSELSRCNDLVGMLQRVMDMQNDKILELSTENRDLRAKLNKSRQKRAAQMTKEVKKFQLLGFDSQDFL